MPTDGTPRHVARRIIWGPPLALVAVALLRALPYRAFEPDDLYIYLQFVRNLLERRELSFNPGEPAYGFTSPLWLLLLSAGTAVLRDPFLAAKIASLLVSIATPVLLYLLALRLTGERGLAFLAGLAWAFNAWLARWSFAGLEGALSAALPIAAILLALFARDRGRFPWGAAVLSGIAPLVRPEMIGWWLLFALWCAFAWPGPAGARLRAGGIALLPGLLAAGGFAAFTLLHFGRLVPNTAEAKGSIVPVLSTFLPSVARIARVVASTSGIEALFWAAGATVFVARGGLRRLVAGRDPGAAGLMAAWAIGLVGLYGVRGVTVYTRYLLMLLPFVVIGGFLAMAPLWRADRLRRSVVLAVTGIILGQNLVLDRQWIRPATRNYERSMREVNLFLGDWLRENTPPGAVVAVPDIGAIGYLSRRRILDMNGLVTPDLIPYKRSGRVNDYLAERRPDYIIDINADPEAMLKQGPDLPIRLVFTRPFHNMFIVQPEPLYYSLYEVRKAGEERHEHHHGAGHGHGPPAGQGSDGAR